jgi:hypothetical protein
MEIKIFVELHDAETGKKPHQEVFEFCELLGRPGVANPQRMARNADPRL